MALKREKSRMDKKKRAGKTAGKRAESGTSDSEESSDLEDSVNIIDKPIPKKARKIPELNKQDSFERDRFDPYEEYRVKLQLHEEERAFLRKIRRLEKEKAEKAASSEEECQILDKDD